MAQAVHGLRRMTIVKLYGIHVYRQENIMEKKILFTSDNNTLQEKNTDYEIFNIEDDYPLSKHTAHQSFGLDHDSVMTRLQLLWVHFACLCFISFYGMYLLYKISIRRIQQLQNLKDTPDRFTIIVREIPLCIEQKARDCCVDHFFSKHYPNTHYSYQVVYNAENLDELMNQTKSLARKIEDLKESCMTKKHKNKLPLLNFSQQTSSSKVDLLEEKLLALYHKIHQLQCKDMLKKKELPVAFVTFKPRSAAAVAAQLQQHTHPLLWVTELAPEPRDVSWRNLRADFVVTYILTDGLSGFSLEVLQPGLLIWDTLKSCAFGCQREKSPYLYSLPYFRIIPFISLSILIGVVYAVVVLNLLQI
ncbi:Early-responsive to dehydration stress protein (ERD4) [Trifolium repens]|nr:Early-responsive to dehydration stress protein (ERD4) [Trifolium repens]